MSRLPVLELYLKWAALQVTKMSVCRMIQVHHEVLLLLIDLSSHSIVHPEIIGQISFGQTS